MRRPARTPVVLLLLALLLVASAVLSAGDLRTPHTLLAVVVGALVSAVLVFAAALGVVTGIIGAPVFVLLMGRRRYRYGGGR